MCTTRYDLKTSFIPSSTCHSDHSVTHYCCAPIKYSINSLICTIFLHFQISSVAKYRQQQPRNFLETRERHETTDNLNEFKTQPGQHHSKRSLDLAGYSDHPSSSGRAVIRIQPIAPHLSSNECSSPDGYNSRGCHFGLLTRIFFFAILVSSISDSTIKVRLLKVGWTSYLV